MMYQGPYIESLEDLDKQDLDTPNLDKGLKIVVLNTSELVDSITFQDIPSFIE